MIANPRWTLGLTSKQKVPSATGGRKPATFVPKISKCPAELPCHALINKKKRKSFPLHQTNPKG